MSWATLIDTTKCVGCRSCQVSCKQWNELPGEQTTMGRTLQNPSTVSAKTLTVVTYHEIADDKSPGGLRYVFAKRQCMHCGEPACVSACPVTAMSKTGQGAVVYDEKKCIGCRYCIAACPFEVPSADWDSLAPKIHKCDLCFDRVAAKPGESPACVKQCPAGALTFGERDALLKQARARIDAHPNHYVNHIYGEKEAGGTGMLYLSSVPFANLGFPDVGTDAYPRRSAQALSAVPPAVIGVGALLGAAVKLRTREAEVRHVEFETLQRKEHAPSSWTLLALIAFAGISMLARAALGLGGSTNLSDSQPWGLWILFDLVWIALAAGAFATAGLIYVFQRKDLYSIGRGAVLLGLLSYSFVTVTLIVDLGLPWHFWQLALNRPEHSAMFEVSWCVGLYVTILALEFAPVPLAHLGLTQAAQLWKKYAPLYVVAALTLFVFLMSGRATYALAALAAFGFLAWTFRKRDEPIMLAIAAVTLSSMHQSSLGSLFLLVPDRMSRLWWSPVMPLEFFVSSIAAGVAVVLLVQLWMARAWDRRVAPRQISSLATIAFWSLLAYAALRFGGVAFRGAGGRHGDLFLAEMAVTVIPLVLLGMPRVRETPAYAGWAAALGAASIVVHRTNVVLFAMDSAGALPYRAHVAYVPTAYEWGVSIGLLALSVYLIAKIARLLPVLPKHGHGEA